MNKNSKFNRSIALRNFHRGQKDTVCSRTITVPGETTLKVFSFTIPVGTRPRVRRHAKVAWQSGKADRANRAPNVTPLDTPVETLSEL